MCWDTATKTTPPPPPAPKVSVPNRHQIRNLIRKVARTMRTKDGRKTINGSMDSWDFVNKCLAPYLRDVAKGEMSHPDYDKTWNAIDKAVKASTFFTKEEGICGSVKLTLRRTAKL